MGTELTTVQTDTETRDKLKAIAEFYGTSQYKKLKELVDSSFEQVEKYKAAGKTWPELQKEAFELMAKMAQMEGKGG